MAFIFKLPELGENVSSATVSRVLVSVGDTVAVNQTVLEVETDKALAEIPCPVAGVVKEVRVNAGGSVKAGMVVMVIEESNAAAAPVSPKALESAPEAPSASPKPPPASAPSTPPSALPKPRAAGAPVPASPSVRRLARELGVDLNAVPTADPTGRITAHDVMAFAQGKTAVTPGIEPAQAAEAPTPAKPPGEEGQDAYGPVIYEPMNAIRRKTAEHLAHAWSSIPHVTHFEKADITELEEARRRHAKKMEAAGGRLTLICFVLKVLVEAFRRFPKFNATVDLENQRLVLKRYYHIGVAVDTPAGLVVPVLRDVDKMSIAELAVALPALAEKARARKLALEDMQGGGFTVTNLGGLGGVGFTPIINAPEVAILGMSRSVIEPAYREHAFAPRLMLPLSLSYDHRVIDGADAARFMRFVAEALENPWSMWLEKGNMP